MLAIRMRRVGAKKRPFFRVVVAESASARDGRFVEILGHYHPRTKPTTFEVNRERVQYWLDRGAKPSDTVRTLLARHAAAPAAPEGEAAAPAADAPAAP